VRDGARELVALCRAGTGPALLECLTYRLRGHYEGDPARYREATELAEWREKDPLLRFAPRVSADEAAAAEREARAMVERATAFARQSPFPDPRELTTDVRDPLRNVNG